MPRLSPGKCRVKLTLGLGCDRGTPAATIIAAIDEALATCSASPVDIGLAASINLKANEYGLLQAMHHFGWRLRFYSAAELATVAVPNPSETVRRHTGTPSVSEAAALLAAGNDTALLLIEKYKRRGPDGRNATVSIARIIE